MKVSEYRDSVLYLDFSFFIIKDMIIGRGFLFPGNFQRSPYYVIVAMFIVFFFHHKAIKCDANSKCSYD